jgi:hypothetical protein
VPATKTDRRDESGAAVPINNAALAYIHENGAPEVGIPARPFLGPSVKENKSEIVAGFKVAGELAGKGNAAAVERQLHRIGLRAQAAARKKITEGPFVPLKPATIAARKRKRKSRKNTDIRPLIDTAQLRNSLSYVIKKV